MQILPDALDCNISEFDFWDMTIAEVQRAVDSYNRRMSYRRKEKAEYDYILANLIGLSVARLFDENAKYPSLHEAYPALYEKELEQDKVNASVARFLAFAQAHNKKVEQEGKI